MIIVAVTHFGGYIDDPNFGCGRFVEWGVFEWHSVTGSRD